LSALSALGATVSLRNLSGVRPLAIEQFITGALRSALRPGEIIETVRIPAMTPSARFGYFKACRKTGEFAHAIGAVLIDPEQATARAVIGALEAAPIVLADASVLFGGRVTADFGRRFDVRVADAILAKSGISSTADRHIHVTALRRAISEAAA
jgi:carbon-monoxide dehydrogenase medium subunit